jgi:hypothetical protein
MLPLVRAWTEEEHERLRAMVLAGKSALLCAAALNRKVSPVKIQARRIGTPFSAMREVRRAMRDAQNAADRDVVN